MGTGAIASADIDITSITQTMERSRNGSAYSAITDPTISFSKADGLVYMDYEFKAAQWQVGDMYRMSLSGITCTIAGDTAYVPAMIWNNIVVEAEDLTNNTQYLYGVADGGTTYPTKVIDNSILSILMTKQSGGDTSDFDNSTDSLEAISDAVAAVQGDLGNPSIRTNLQTLEAMLGNPDAANKTIYGNIGDFVGQTNLQTLLAALGIPDVAGKPLYTCLVTDRLDNATYGLSAIETLVDDVETELAKVPKSDSNVTWNATALGSINAEVDTALNTIVPSSPTAGSLNDILSKAAGGNTFDKSTDSLEALADTLATIPTVTGAGTLQMKATTIDLQQAANTYDLFTGATQAVMVEKLTFALPNVNVADDVNITYITIQSNHSTAQVIFNSTTGAKANLTAEQQLSWNGPPIYLGVGKKIQLTIAGGAADAATVCNVVAEYRAVVSGGTLST